MPHYRDFVQSDVIQQLDQVLGKGQPVITGRRAGRLAVAALVWGVDVVAVPKKWGDYVVPMG